MKLENRVAVITGAGSGIGLAIAERFAQEGARVVVAELRPEAAQAAAERIRAAGGTALPLATDVSDAAQVAALFQALDEQGWPVDILVNNAGNVEKQLAPLAETTDETWYSVLRVHLDGTFFCARQALRRMVPRQQGVIVNFSSVAGLSGLPGASAYTAAKGAILALTKSLAQEVAPLGIRVNCIAPGWVETPILENLPQRWRDRMVPATPLGRIGRPEEIAGVALFLASDDSSFVIGQTISPNGGMYR